MTTNEAVRLVAEYDGWVVALPHTRKGEPMMDKPTSSACEYLSNLKYLTSLDWLHPVAMKLLNELRAKELELIDYYNNQPFHVDDIVNQEVIYAKRKFRNGGAITNILLACSAAPINNEYIDLFNAVYDGIVYLKSQTNGNNS
jgi:hypothetical protein